jgi:hypothetical protein
MGGDVFDPGILMGGVVAALWLLARPIVEWLVAPALRRVGLEKPRPYDPPVWWWRARLALRAYLGGHGHTRDDPQRGHGRAQRAARPAGAAHTPRRESGVLGGTARGERGRVQQQHLTGPAAIPGEHW